MSLLFEKLYADLVTPEGDVCVAYAARIGLWGANTCMAAVEVYPAAGGRAVFRGRCEEPLPASGEGPLRALRIGLDGGMFILRYGDGPSRWDPPGPPPAPGLRWSVTVPDAPAIARLPGGPELRGRGYADRVRIEGWPRGLRLEELRWGRVHDRNRALVFTKVRFTSGGSWTRVGEWSANGFRSWSDAGVREEGEASLIRLPGAGDAGREIQLLPRRTLHAGGALDAGRFPSPAARAALRLLAGRPAETRWLAWAMEPGWIIRPGQALHERVVFSPARAGAVRPPQLDRRGARSGVSGLQRDLFGVGSGYSGRSSSTVSATPDTAPSEKKSGK